MKLPLWRAILGFATLGALLLAFAVAGEAYLDNYRLDGFMRQLAVTSATASDDELRARILGRAAELELPVPAESITITREGSRPRIRIERYALETPLLRLDLRMPAASAP